MSSQTDFIQVTEDGGILKQILTPSTSDQTPKKGEKVEGALSKYNNSQINLYFLF